jgi:hypothetical protein
MVWLPTAKPPMPNEAVMKPPELVTPTGLPALLPSIWNCTVPLGVPAPGAPTLMVAVNVTLWLMIAGLTVDTTAVVVLALLTICVMAVELLAAKFVSPPKEAVIRWLPTIKLALLKLAVVVAPLVVSVPWPMLVPPSEKITAPVGLAEALPLTVAVKLTFWPHTEGLTEETSSVTLLPALLTICVMAVELLAVKFVSPL